jgi:hypothetical protein
LLAEMANQEHLDILAMGVAPLNVAEGNRYPLPDLSDTALNGANLMDAALIDANLTGV